MHGCGQYDPNDTFQQIDDLLESEGYYTTFANLETSKCGTPPLARNVPNLRLAINRAKLETGQSRVILIAHSMGGLVSRAYLESDDYRRRQDVKELFTFGTPHHGIPVEVLGGWVSHAFFIPPFVNSPR
jgi:triacylglycerol esterase/lipase EstA (alpha/beta hydrolase family)